MNRKIKSYEESIDKLYELIAVQSQKGNDVSHFEYQVNFYKHKIQEELNKPSALFNERKSKNKHLKHRKCQNSFRNNVNIYYPSYRRRVKVIK